MSGQMPVEQLYYTWSDVGFSSIHAGFRIRAASPGLVEIYGERVQSIDRHMRYFLPPGTNPNAIRPQDAPVCLAFLCTTQNEAIVVHKNYVGEDGVGRQGNFFVHVFALGAWKEASTQFTSLDALMLWEAEHLWQTSETGLPRQVDRLQQLPSLKSLKAYEKLELVSDEEVLRYLPFLISAYLTRKDEQTSIYLAAPADQQHRIVFLMARLLECLPEQLVANVTFSTYEPDITKSNAVLVGTSWIASPGGDGTSQVFPPRIYQEKLALNCLTGDKSNLNSHPLIAPHPKADLVASFARYAAESLEVHDTEVLASILNQVEQAEEKENNRQTVLESLLHIYYDEVLNPGSLSTEDVEYYLRHPVYRLQKLWRNTFRDNVIILAQNHPKWRIETLQPLLSSLSEEGRKEQIALASGTAQNRQNSYALEGTAANKESTRSQRRKSWGKAGAQSRSTTILEALSRLGESAAYIAATTMKHYGQTHDRTRPDDLSVIKTLLGLINSSVLAEDTYGIWKSLLRDIQGSAEAYHCLTENKEELLFYLFKRWRRALPYPDQPADMNGLLPLLKSVSWSDVGSFLALGLYKDRPEWNAIVIQKLAVDGSLNLRLAQQLTPFAEEINAFLLHQLSREPHAIPITATFVTHLIENGYRGKPPYSKYLDALFSKLGAGQHFTETIALVKALAHVRQADAHCQQIETFLDALLSERPRDGWEVCEVLVNTGYGNKARLVPLLLRSGKYSLEAVLYLVYPTDAELAQFYMIEGKDYLSAPDFFQAMLRIYRKIVAQPGRVQRLFVLLDALTTEERLQQDAVMGVLGIAELKSSQEYMELLQRYGPRYLTEYSTSPGLAQFVIDTFAWLVQRDSAYKPLLRTLFSVQTSITNIERLVVHADLSGSDLAEFFRLYGTREKRLVFFRGSSVTVKLLKRLRTQAVPFSAEEKLAMLFVWLDPRIEPQTFDLRNVAEIIKAAAFTDAEYKMFLEKLGIAYLQSPSASLVVDAVKRYVLNFTVQDFERREARTFLLDLKGRAVSHLKLDHQVVQCLSHWMVIATYPEAPDKFDATILKRLGDALRSVYLTDNPTFIINWITEAFIPAAEEFDQLKVMVQVMMSATQISGSAILYTMAEKAADHYSDSISGLAFYALFILTFAPDFAQQKQGIRSDHLILEFLDTALRGIECREERKWEKLHTSFLEFKPPRDAQEEWISYLSHLNLGHIISGKEKRLQRAKKLREALASFIPKQLPLIGPLHKTDDTSGAPGQLGENR